jgi:DNA-binding CsgD family transcriptional regulator
MTIFHSYAAFLSYVQQCQSSRPDEPVLENAFIRDRDVKFAKYIDQLASGLYILDYTEKKYRQVNDRMSSITGFRNSYMLDGGLEFGLSIWHPDDLKIFSKRIMVDNLQFIRSIPAERQAEYLFTCNYRVKTRNGGYKNILQQSAFIRSSDAGIPLATMGFLTDVSRIAGNTRMTHAIEHIGRPDRSGKPHGIVFERSYFLHERDALLTRREVEVLKWICEGLNSRQIAARLHLSVNTVNNHRRSILRKTNCRTTMSLLRYALERGHC